MADLGSVALCPTIPRSLPLSALYSIPSNFAFVKTNDMAVFVVILNNIKTYKNYLTIYSNQSKNAGAVLLLPPPAAYMAK